MDGTLSETLGERAGHCAGLLLQGRRVREESVGVVVGASDFALTGLQRSLRSGSVEPVG
ncbi:hypothetical protein [Streptomyces sp. NPDC054837]